MRCMPDGEAVPLVGVNSPGCCASGGSAARAAAGSGLAAAFVQPGGEDEGG
jgi:hypothetical protein